MLEDDTEAYLCDLGVQKTVTVKEKNLNFVHLEI
jgi:hypothetical protein